MKKNGFHRIVFHPIFVGFFCFLIILAITQITAYQFHKIEKEKERQKTELLALSLKSNLEILLNHGITAAKLIETLVESEIPLNEIKVVCDDIISRNPFIDALQVVKDETIIFTHPLDGNEITIGYKVLRDTYHLEEAIKAYDRKDIYFEGPINLIQGGVGIVGRLPIMKNDTLWGFSAVIIKEKNFLNFLSLKDSLSEKVFDFYLTKYDSTGKEIALIPQLSSLDLDGIYHHVSIPSGDWTLTVISKNDFFTTSTLLISILGILLSISFGFFLWNLSKQPYILKKQVNERTLELKQLNKSLQLKAEQLEKSNRDLEQFAYIASHDLQEPSRMVNSFLERLQKKYGSELDEKANKYIDFAVQGSKRMLQIIKDLLEFSRVGHSKKSLQAVDLNKLFNEVCAFNSNSIKAFSATIKYKDLPTIQSNYSLLIQVFQNLIENSLKYHKEGRPPVIEIKVEDKKENWQISVSDNGIGIESEYFDKIFLIFQRLHSDSDYKGSGIGLSIVKKIVDGLDGKIWLKSKLNVGTTFYINLPK